MYLPAGQTGSGKTFTLLGYGDTPGLVGLAVARICAFAQQSRDEVHMKISMLEIYKERIRDLLVEPSSKQSSLKVQVASPPPPPPPPSPHMSTILVFLPSRSAEEYGKVRIPVCLLHMHVS